MSWNIWEMATCLRVLDVTKFGAKPDVAGGGDGIQDAIDYAIANQTDKSWAIWVPPGDWKLTKPLILARSGDFIRVHMIGVPSSYASLGSQIIFDSLLLPVLIVQGARACTFEGLSFKGGNDIRGKFKPPYDMLVGDDSVFLKPGARDNPYSPQAVVQIDPFMPEYPDNDIANAYPSLEGYYGGSELPEPTGNSAITFRNCYFEAGVVGVGVSTPGPGQVGHDLVQNAENFAFENCSWVGCREAFVSGQSQSRGLNLHNPRIAFCRIAIDSSQYGLGGNPGNAPRLTGAPNIGICKYLFNVVTSWQVFTCENLYCEATMSIGFISHGFSTGNMGAHFKGCTFSFHSTEPGIPHHLRSFGGVVFDKCAMGTDNGEPLRIWNSEGRLVLRDCSVLMDDKSDNVQIGFHDSANITVRRMHTRNTGIGPVYKDDYSDAVVTVVDGGNKLPVVQGPTADKGEFSPTDTTTMAVGDLVKIKNESLWQPERYPSSAEGYKFHGVFGVITEKQTGPNLVKVDHVPEGFPFFDPEHPELPKDLRLETIRWDNG